MHTPPQPPAGWYDDPADASQRRFWDGDAWTERTQPRAPGADAPAAGDGGDAGTTPGDEQPTEVIGEGSAEVRGEGATEAIGQSTPGDPGDLPTEDLGEQPTAVFPEHPTEVLGDAPAPAAAPSGDTMPADGGTPAADGARDARTRWWLVAAAVAAAVLLVGGVTTAALLTAGSSGDVVADGSGDADAEGGSDAVGGSESDEGSDAAGDEAATEPDADEPAPDEPADPVDPVAFAREAERRLDRMERDIDALERDIEDARFERLAAETVRLAVQLDELRAIGTPEELAGGWEADLDAIDAGIDRLAEAVVADDPDAAEDAADEDEQEAAA